MDHQTIDWCCPVCCYSYRFTIPDDRARTLAVQCPMCGNVSPLVGSSPWPFRLGESLHDTPQATNVRTFPKVDPVAARENAKRGEYCKLTEQERIVSERLLRLALEG